MQRATGARGTDGYLVVRSTLCPLAISAFLWATCMKWPSRAVRFVCPLLVSRGGQMLQLIQVPQWLFLVQLRPVAMFPWRLQR